MEVGSLTLILETGKASFEEQLHSERQVCVGQENSGSRVPRRWNFVSKTTGVREGGTNTPGTWRPSVHLEQASGKSGDSPGES